MINIKTLTTILEQFKLTDEQAEELQKVIYKLTDKRMLELPDDLNGIMYVIDEETMEIVPIVVTAVKIAGPRILDNDCTISATYTGTKAVLGENLETVSLTRGYEYYFDNSDIDITVFTDYDEASEALKDLKQHKL